MLETLKSCLLRVGGCLSTTAVFLLLLLFFVFLVFLVWFGFQGRVASSRPYEAGEQKPCWFVSDNRSADSQCSRKAKHLLPSLSFPLIPTSLLPLLVLCHQQYVQKFLPVNRSGIESMWKIKSLHLF